MTRPVEHKVEDFNEGNAILKQSSGSFKTESDSSYNSSQSVDLDVVDELNGDLAPTARTNRKPSIVNRSSTITKKIVKLNQFELKKMHAPGDISPQKRKAIARIEKKKKTD